MYSPSKEEFIALAAQGNLIPVTRRLLADFETPLSAYQKIRGPGEAFLFESVEGGEHLGRYSFVGCNPRAIIRQTGSRVEYIENGKVIEQFNVGQQPSLDAVPFVRDGLAVVERVLKNIAPSLCRSCLVSPVERWVSSATNSFTMWNPWSRDRPKTN